MHIYKEFNHIQVFQKNVGSFYCILKVKKKKNQIHILNWREPKNTILAQPEPDSHF